MRYERTHAAAQSGRDAAVDSAHGVTEFWIIALHITEVVNRA